LHKRSGKGFDCESKRRERERENDKPYILTRDGYQLIKKDKVYFTDKLTKQIFLEVRQDAIAEAG